MNPVTPTQQRDLVCSTPLFTDLYQLTMMQGYFLEGMHDQEATFDLYYRKQPYSGGFAVWAGLEPALDYLEHLSFSPADLDYLAALDLFRPEFLAALRDWRFSGTVTAFREGRIVFPHVPLLSVTAPLWEAQLVETALLNTLNFQTLVATKAARCVISALSSPYGGEVVEFGARRAQGPNGALSAARAAFVGGATATSNVEAGLRYGLPLSGTHAHAWVQSFGSELEAFRAYASAYPDSTVLLLDTVDTLKSGLVNALTVARELRAKGHELRGVRLDSGDLVYLSRRVRAALDEAGFPDVKIIASNDLDEQVIASVIAEGGRIDVYGVGTQLATAGGDGGGALGGVYKLAALNGEPKMKLTGDPIKSNVPGVKRVWRGRDREGILTFDVMTLGGQPKEGDLVSDPTNPLKHTHLPALEWEDVREVVMRDGQRVHPADDLPTIQARARTEALQLQEGTLRLLNPHHYKVSIGQDVSDLRDQTVRNIRADRVGG
ncbi:nicotinate phosphoribosyltransferase [Deinococcus piscis]|uniref:Nicotinate phosphoribosyltransferase n=1 Tax=Deinococcus piscis TaxID=394230 RepID=A0ABQ3KC50_9DEIO|nr:nicotinate phosphoribosyltransferase [Deinococcus piscis]GHG07080.1 nicotinate phosphoribosyltransferase [Deinococcus piscis]